MLEYERLTDLFPEERPIATRARSDVSTYYSDRSKVTNSLISDGCIIAGSVENCIISSGVRIEHDVKLKNCIVMNNTTIHSGAELSNVVLDKDVDISAGLKLVGSDKLPLVVPRNGTL